MYIVCLKQYRVMYLIKQCSMMYMSMSLNNLYTVMYAIKKQDARAFKYMSEATINTSYFGCQLLLLFFFLGWEGVWKRGGSKLKSEEKRPWGIV